MNDNLKLQISLLLLFVLSIVLHIRIGWDGIFINLATEIIGIVITIVYVNFMIEQIEKKKWRLPKEEINKQITNYVDNSINNLLYSLGYSYNDQDWSDFINKSQNFTGRAFSNIYHRHLIDISKTFLSRSNNLREGDFSPLHTEKISDFMDEITNNSMRILNLYREWLLPDQLVRLIKILEEANTIKSIWTTLWTNIYQNLPTDKRNLAFEYSMTSTKEVFSRMIVLLDELYFMSFEQNH